MPAPPHFAFTFITTPGVTPTRRGCASGSSAGARFEEPPSSDWGWIDITNIRIIGVDGAAGDLTKRMRFIAPDDGNAADRTVMEVPLDRAVGPGETLNVQIAWSSRVPYPFARTGAIGNFYFLGQWFPKIGVLENSGWNCHQFHATTEFFADFGTYDVRLTVPRGWIVGATGTERDSRDEAGRHDDASLLRGGRPRFRVDDEPGLRRASRDVRAPDAAAGRVAAAASEGT